MIRTLTAIYLHRAGKLDARRLPVIECGMADAFRDFCRETFDVDAPLDYPPLKIVLMLRSVKACAAFRKALLKAHIQWEKASATTILFLVTAGTAEEHFEYLFRVCREFKKLIGAPVARGRARSGTDAKSVVEAVHGLFCRGGHAPYFVEVLNRDEESRVRPPEGV